MEPATSQKRPRSPRRLILYVSICTAVLAGICYRVQPDSLTAFTMIPSFCWLLWGAGLTVLGFNRRHWKLAVFSAALWVLFACVIIEQCGSLLRSFTRDRAEIDYDDPDSQHIRVVSLNCYTGLPKVADEVIPYEPDIVLFQESPGRDILERLSKEMFGDEGSVLWSPDTSLVCRGRIKPRVADRDSHFVLATLTTPDGRELDVASVRLNPPVFRADLWSPSCWTEHRDNRRLHRRQLEEVVESLKQDTGERPIIVGGDFNLPADDGALTELRPFLVDAFQIAGVGWGNTGTNTYPLWRVDQIWISPELHPSLVVAMRTLGSDHRMVVCDLLFKTP